jgi:hypothetical protein
MGWRPARQHAMTSILNDCVRPAQAVKRRIRLVDAAMHGAWDGETMLNQQIVAFRSVETCVNF